MGETVDPLSELSLPPGFRFNPTDEELMVHYLCPKVAGRDFAFKIIGDLDLYKHDPWVLPGKALSGDKEWYFFTPRDRKYPNGSRPNRVAGTGYWKATGTDKVITSEGKRVGIKKSLVFYIGKAPKGSKTNWIMHEYRILEPQRRTRSLRLDEWVLCRIYKKNSSAQRTAADVGMAGTECSNGSSSSSSSLFDEPLQQAITDLSKNNLDDKQTDQNAGQSSVNNFDWAAFTGLNTTVPENCGGSSGVQFSAYKGTEQGVMNTINNYNQTDMQVPSVDTGFGNIIDQEVQSGFPNQQAGDSGFLNPNTYAQGFINSTDPDPYAAVRYPNQPGNSGNRN